LNTLLLTPTLEGEAKYVGAMLSSLANNIIETDEPIPKPAAIVAAGETTVTVTGKGLGGRNQELVLAAALKLREREGAAVASLSTDGTDGPTVAAGAIADTQTRKRALELGLKAERFLRQNDSYNFFAKLEDSIITGPTGTNVNDISVIIVL